MAQSGKKTRKNRTSSRGKVHSISGVRNSIHHMTNYANTIVHKKGASTTTLANSFAAEWKRTFGKSLPKKVAESYIKTMMKKGKKTRKNYRGGALLSGAPLAALTRPDTDIPYGEFPKYVSGGFVNPEPAILKDCGHQQGIMPQAGMGSNTMKGGSFFKYAFPLDTTASIRNFGEAALFRPFINQNPPTTQYKGMADIKGLPSYPGSEASEKTWNYRSNPYSSPPSSGIGIYERTLPSTEIVLPGSVAKLPMVGTPLVGSSLK
jgi:hypothetical protein